MCDCELPEFFNHRVVAKTRKIFRCCECRRDILPGSTCHVSSGKWNGCFDEFRQCDLCFVLSNSLQRYQECCVGFGELWSDFKECFPRYRSEYPCWPVVENAYTLAEWIDGLYEERELQLEERRRMAQQTRTMAVQ